MVIFFVAFAYLAAAALVTLICCVLVGPKRLHKLAERLRINP